LKYRQLKYFLCKNVANKPALRRLSAKLMLVWMLGLLSFSAFAQAPASPDSVYVFRDSVTGKNDTVYVFRESQTRDADTTIQADTLYQLENQGTPKKSIGLETSVKYKSANNIRYDIRNSKVYLTQDAEIVYGDISIKAAYIEIDFARNLVFAKGLPDSTGKLQGTPVFTESGQTFEAEEMTYNFDTKKGIIRQVRTQDGEGYLYGSKIKKMPDDRINIAKGHYTTCNLPNPHYEFRFTKAQVIPDNKIVSGPAYMVIEDVPVPLVVPFGLFPNKSGQRSGIIIPAIGESANRGFFLERGGYYWGISDYMDLTLTGDIYSNGSWAVRPTFRYANRYHYAGNFDFSYGVNIQGDRDSPDAVYKKDFRILWNHGQDAKARPNSRFSASVNIVSSSFNNYNLTNSENYLSNTFQSSIAYQTNFNNNVFLTVDASHQQNTITRAVNMTLPSLNLNTKQFYPFRPKVLKGKPAWYENISLKYTVTAANQIQTYDTLLFKPGWQDDFKMGARHTIPISSSIKLLRYFTMTNTLNYSERWYPYAKDYKWNPETVVQNGDTLNGFFEIDTTYGFQAAREFSFSSSVSTRLYGMYQFKKGAVKAIRHVVTPTASFNMRPDFGSDFWGYYQEVQKAPDGTFGRYSIFDGLLYGGPPDRRSGMISFGFNNNLEMKVRSRNDTITGTKKIGLIDNLSFNMSYDIARDTMQWSPLSIRGNTILFKKLNVTYSSSWTPYAVDSSGRSINKFQYDVDQRLFRMSNTVWNFGLNYRFGSSDFKKGKAKQQAPGAPLTEDAEILQNYSEQEIRDIMDNPDDYINWNNAWNISLNYNLSFSNNPIYINYDREDKRTTVQTLGLSGDVSITPKWKVNFSTNYDFNSLEFGYTQIDFYRDLHCWEMRFSWIPSGQRKSWTFGINVKASILRDLKYDRKKDFRDAYR
jgi:lipopolysaccharide assembly outer membrane protein LptD (OstA)